MLVGLFNSGDADHDGKLDIGETWHYTATHTVTQADLDAGGTIPNTATAHGIGAADVSASATVPVEQRPSLNIVKDADPGQVADVAGEQITYSISVENTGNVTLTEVGVSDPYADAGSIQLVIDAASSDGELDVGETWHYTAAHTVTQSEIDSNGGGDGFLENTATAHSHQAPDDSDTAEVPVAQHASLTIDKQVSIGGEWLEVGPGGLTSPTLLQGNNPEFRFIVTNTGNVTLNGITVTDDLANLGVISSLGVNETAILYETGTWQQGNHVDTATASTSFNNQTVSDTDQADYTGQTASVFIDKMVSVDGINWIEEGQGNIQDVMLLAGDTVYYRVEVRNTGEATLNVSGASDHADAGVIPLNPYTNDYSFTFNGGSPTVVLAAGESIFSDVLIEQASSINGNYQQDTATVTAAASDDGGHTVTATDSDVAGWTVGRPALTIDKQVSVDGGNTWLEANVGVLTHPTLLQGTAPPMYRFIVTNTGDIDLNGITVTDDKLGNLGTISLAAGASNALMPLTATGTWQGGTQHRNGQHHGNRLGGGQRHRDSPG